MIPMDMPQGSIEWIIARLWRLTGSELKRVISPKTGALSNSQAAREHIDKLIAGITLANVMQDRASDIEDLDDWELKKFMSHYVGTTFAGNIHTERGNEFEADAIAAMSAKIGKHIGDVGMCLMGDSEKSVVSCSPDGVIRENNQITEGAEVKNPCLSGYLRHVREDILPPEHALQVHSGMAICEVETWHYGSYFDGKELFYKEVKRDKYTEVVRSSLEKFADVYRNQYAEIQGKLENLKPTVSPQEGNLI